MKEIQSLSSVIGAAKEKFPGSVHMRVPVCNSAALLEAYFDIVTNTLLGSAINTSVIINDQVGLSRATTGCVIACLFKEFQITSSVEGLVETVPGMNLNLLKMDTYKMDMNKDTLFSGEFPVVVSWVEQLADGVAAKNVCDKTINENGTPKTGGTGIKQLRENIAESKFSYEIMDDAVQAFLKPKIMGNIHKLDCTDTKMLTTNALIEDENWSEAYERHHQSPKTTEGLLFDKPGYEDRRLDKEPRMEQRLWTQSLKNLRIGQVKHTHSRCKSQLEANCPDRKKGERMPWEETWQTTERKRYQKTRNGDWDKAYDQTYEASDERFSNAFGYEDRRHCEESIVHEGWGQRFLIELGDKQELDSALAICHTGKDMTEHVAGKWEKIAIKTEDGMGCNTVGTLALTWITLLERVGILKVFGGPSLPNTLKPKLMKRREKMGLMEITKDMSLEMVEMENTTGKMEKERMEIEPSYRATGIQSYKEGSGYSGNKLREHIMEQLGLITMEGSLDQAREDLPLREQHK